MTRDFVRGHSRHMNIKSENEKLRGILLDAMGKRPMTRDELLTYTAQLYCKDANDEAEQSPAEEEELTHTVRSLAGTVLGALYRGKKVTRDANGRYSPVGKETVTEPPQKKPAGASRPAPSPKAAKNGKNTKGVTNTGTEKNTENPPRPAKPTSNRQSAESPAKPTPVRTAEPDRTAIESEILSALAEKPLRRAELFRVLDEAVGVGGDPEATAKLHRTAEEILKDLKQRKAVGSSFGVFRPAAIAKNGNPDGQNDRKTQMRRAPGHALPAENSDKLRRHFLVRLYARGGAYLEQYAMNLLIKYYQDSGKVIRGSRVTGGSADGGIDGILEITDWLGFRECIMIQTKCRGSIQVTEKEIREFYGVVCSRNGSRGIFITTSTFHDSAKKLLAAIDNCVGVDGEKLFLMACRCHYGIRQGARGDEIDPDII